MSVVKSEYVIKAIQGIMVLVIGFAALYVATMAGTAADEAVKPVAKEQQELKTDVALIDQRLTSAEATLIKNTEIHEEIKDSMTEQKIILIKIAAQVGANID